MRERVSTSKQIATAHLAGFMSNELDVQHVFTGL
jgi:hypothetical protein